MNSNSIDFRKFPTTRYQGSKRKIASWIHDNIKELRFNQVLDGFGGSGTVSYLFKSMGKEVTYNDKLLFNTHIGKAIIENHSIKFTEEDIANLETIHPNVEYTNLITRNYEGVFYLPNENSYLDVIAPNIIQMNHYQGTKLIYKRALASYALYQACLIKRPFNLFHRKNLNIRTAKVTRNFGNKATWDRPFPNYLRKFVNEANSLVFNSGKKCLALNESIFSIDPYGYDLVYLDPPYLRKDVSVSSSNYMTHYHFLEGLAKYSEWETLLDRSKPYLPMNTDYSKSDFSHRNAKEKFEEMLYKFRKSKIVLSYKNGGVPSIGYLTNLMKKIKKNTATRSIKYTYALNSQNSDHKSNREYLIIGT